MCDGRTFEEVDDMTLFDVAMINKYRSRHPRTEDLLAGIAVYLGTYKPPAVTEEVPDVKSVPDPRAVIIAAFAESKFDPSVGVLLDAS